MNCVVGLIEKVISSLLFVIEVDCVVSGLFSVLSIVCLVVVSCCFCVSV